VQAAIERKVAGKEVSIAEPPSYGGDSNVVDLMDALKASLRGSRAGEMKRKAPKKAPARGEVISAKKSSRR
jgi:DNA end-binding protein Ku